MNSLIIWIPLTVSLVVLVIVAAGLRTKSAKLNRQLERAQRYRSNFESRTVPKPVVDSADQIPTMSEAKAQRDNFLKKRTKKRADKQRRLVSRLKSRS